MNHQTILTIKLDESKKQEPNQIETSLDDLIQQKPIFTKERQKRRPQEIEIYTANRNICTKFRIRPVAASASSPQASSRLFNKSHLEPDAEVMLEFYIAFFFQTIPNVLPPTELDFAGLLLAQQTVIQQKADEIFYINRNVSGRRRRMTPGGGGYV